MFSSCRSKIIEYKWLLLLLISYFGILVYCSPLDITQLAGGDKCFAFLYSAETGERLYNAPLYTLLSWFAVRLPFSDGFSLSMFLSIFPAVGSVACVYIAIKKQTNIRNAPMFGALCLVASFAFVSQTVKVDIYILTAFFLIFGYTLTIYKKGSIAAVAFGLALVSHWVEAIPTVIAFFIYSKEFRRKSYLSLIVAGFVYLIWMLFPVYNKGILDQGMLASLSILLRWWGSGSLSDFFGNFSRIPIAIFIIGFGWIPVLLYFLKDFRKAAPIIFITGILFVFLFIAPSDAAYQQIATIVPFLAVAAGLGFVYIVNINFKRIIICGLLLTVLSIPIVWNIDANPTTARSMINQLDNVPDNSVIMCYRQIDNESDPYAISVMWMVHYYNAKYDKHMYPINIPFLWLEHSSSRLQDILDRGLIVSNNKLLIGNYSGTIDNFALNNPNVSLYYYEMTNLEEMRCELRKWQ